MSYNIVHGQCGLCGGVVTTLRIWSGNQAQVPTCQSCGATKRSNLPVLDMVRPPLNRSAIVTPDGKEGE